MVSLLHLPPELLELIACNFNLLEARKPNLQPTKREDLHSFSAAKPSDRSSLSALSATCRHLRNLIQPILYHRVYPYHAEVEFARTLASRPDLARAVRELYYASGAYEDRTQRLLFFKPNKHALKSTAKDESRPEESRSEGSWSAPTNFNDLIAQQPQGYGWTDLHEDENGALALPLQLCHVPARDYLGLKEWLLQNSLLMGTLQLLPKLQSLYLWDELFDHEGILHAGPLPNLQEFQLYNREFSWPEDLSQHTPLIQHMPSLRRLKYHFVRGLSERESHNNVTELVLSNCPMMQVDFDIIAGGFAKLQKLMYTLGSTEGDDIASCRGIFESMLPRRDTLTELSVRLNGQAMGSHRFPQQDVVWQLPEHLDERQFDPTSLSKLHKLRRLSLDHDALDDLLKGGFGNSYDRHLLSSLLPPSLQCADFYLGNPDSDILETLSNWASVCRETHPELKFVTITNWEESEVEIAALAERFRAVDVACSHDAEQSSEKSLMYNHRLGPEFKLESYDDWPGWAFWDPNADPMPIPVVEMDSIPGQYEQQFRDFVT